LPSVPALPGLSLFGFGAKQEEEREPYSRVFRPNGGQPIKVLNGDSGVSSKATHLKILSARFDTKSYYLVRHIAPKYERMPNTAESAGKDLKANVQAVIEFTNNSTTSLPAGSLTLKRREADSFGVRQLADIDIEQTEPGHAVTIPIETVSGIGVSRVVTGYNYDHDKRLMVETFEITVQNNTTIPCTVVVEESMFRWEVWEVSLSSHPFKAHEHSRKVTWTLELNSYGDKETIAYTAFYSHFELPSDRNEAKFRAQAAANAPPGTPTNANKK